MATTRFRPLFLVLLAALLAVGCDDSAESIRGHRLEPLGNDDVPAGLSERASELMKRQADAPIGSEHRIEFEGKTYVGRIERHYHSPDSGKEPVGHHNGVSLFEVKSR